MTIFELFPWLLAISVAALTKTLLARAGLSSALVWIIALAAGIALFAVYWLAVKWLAARWERRRAEKEKWEREHRQYRNFDTAKPYPVGSDLFYECSVCGSIIPSTATKGRGCKCRNIVVDADAHRLEIRDQTKAKLFSQAAG
ncbi:MAG TPA: hypothetical protein VHB20_19465 [Verrucomicrobiae bacterium]|jgi:hypothetical protein|nr:hypothetical protein [Verrucomicrobiae bacterium]